MEKTILLKNAGLLDEEANCILNQNVYVQEGKTLKILPAAEDTESIHADETMIAVNIMSVRDWQICIPILP